MAKKLNATDFIKPHVEVVEEPVEKIKKPTPFTFISSVSDTKVNMLTDDPETIKDYNPFITNRGFGYFPDTVLYANELNMLPNMPKEAQYLYYLGSLRKRKRFSKWHKLEKDLDQELIQNTYNCRPEVAKQYKKILTEKNIETLRNLQNTGETIK